MQEGCVPSQGEGELIEVNADEEKWVSLNFVGAATFKTIIFSIDDHPMWVYEVDGHFIEPQLVQTVNMYAGERYSVMVKLDQKPRDYAIRVSDNCLTQVISAYATLSYDGGRKSRKQVDMTQTRGYIDYAGQHTSTDVVTLDSDHVVPFPAKVPAKTADAEYHFFTHRWNNPYEYTMTGWGLYEEDQNAYKPLLYNVNSREAHDGRTVIRTQNGTWVDLVLNVGSFADQPQEFPHMMHKHASKTWRIGAGMGIWNYTSVAEAMETEPHSFNLVEPPFRDTWVTSFDGPSWMVLRYQVTNPGAFLLHCHVESHLAGGMAVVIMDGVDAWPEIPSEYALGQNGFPLIEEMDDAVVAAQNEKLSEMASTSPLRAGNPSDSALSGLAWFELVLSGGIQFLRGLLKDA
jgi:FtsP/CotA-like multicopper oxidase with cupredoxin domain